MSVDSDPIVRVAARGEGVTASGRHVPMAAPGDVVGSDGSVSAGAHHQQPPCRHYPLCGGCQLQHLDDTAYARFLVDRIEGGLKAQGLATEIRAPILSPPRTRRRATLHAERRGRQVHLGFTQGSSHHLVDLDECWVLTPALFAVLAPLRGLLAAQLTESRRIDVHLAEVDQGIDVVLQGQLRDGLAAAEAITAFSRRHKLARLSIDDGFGPEARWEPDPVTITLGGVAVPMPAGGFLQATREGEATLVDTVRAIIGEPRTVADLFAGLGTFALAMTPATKVYAAEGAREALLALKAGAGRVQRQLFADHRDLFRRPLTAEELNRFDAIMLDPPRAGAHEQTLNLAMCKVPHVAYVSCNPSSFARDAKKLCEGGYSLDWVQPVGQFRWSTHVELVGCFTR
ncbi:class I SAM-dependent RNA methyltransferase [Sphingomonas qomolangmaensis]|uniref:Class I SAM-dependent RNA methyltransferase n=1 Tax=Sphingomonas qomolangmaensis TaxID=2918765 RepID=A0ABY5LCT2_9SPHN|nr:class I SAM-dependent RNA methyltransferase [Sphingomonas qomolangmaensis]UUL83519.1 class I SAM-dependent RNA methyltransferase [Sphingomonas qomolangmaensis]